MPPLSDTAVAPDLLLRGATILCLDAEARVLRGWDLAVHEGRMTLEVADTGCGMDEETRRRIFTPFFTTKGSKGSGLGLPVVASILRERGGDIEVQSAVGKGCTVRLAVPIDTEVPS